MNLKSLVKTAVRTYQKIGGNFITRPSMSLKRESDLATFYYPGLDAVMKKIEVSPELSKKLCRSSKTVGLISTQPKSYYPALTARAGLLSAVCDINVIPLLVRYDHFTNLPSLLSQTALNFQVIFGMGFKPLEREVLAQIAQEKKISLYFQEELEAAAVVASIMSYARMMKKSLRKISVVIEGSGAVLRDIILQLKQEGCHGITLLDERGVMYQRRPNMNREKNALVSLVQARKETKTPEDILKDADVYLTTSSEPVTASSTSRFSEKALIIALRSLEIVKQKKQSLVSCLPVMSNHITDLHMAALISHSLAEGRPLKEDSLQKCRKALSKFYRSPKPDQIVPGLLEKNLMKKLLKLLRK